MDPDTTYLVALGPDPARALLRAGLWEHALAAVPAGGLAWRAQILADRFWWQLADPAGAEAAVAALATADPAAATLAAALPAGAEAGQLREAARITATELQLTWLLGSL